MSDIGEAWDFIKEKRKVVKAARAISSVKLLDENKIFYEVKNSGYHYIVDRRFDFFPTTGKYIRRFDKSKGRGIQNLLKELRR